MSLIKSVGKQMPLSVSEAFSMSGKTVIVTGAAGNVGSGIAEVFAANGANVIMSDLPGEKLTHAVSTLRETYPSIVDVPCDLTQPGQLQALVDQAVARFGRLDSMVNCGAIPSSGMLNEEDVPDFDRLYHTNVRSIWLLTKYAAPHLAKSDNASIVNISSINGHRAVFFCSLYTGTKAAVLAMSRELAVELAPQNIRVNTVSPGTIPNTNRRLDWTLRLLREPYASQIKTEFEPLLDRMPPMQPLQMIGHGHDVGMACYYLCSPAARFITGIDILVDGGKSMEMHEVEPRFHGGTPSLWKQLRMRLLELPDEAWIDQKPKWLTRIKAQVKAASEAK